MQNKRHCELCKEKFVFVEELGSPFELFKSAFKYITSDKRRVFKLGIYLLYIYLFAKRALALLKYFILAQPARELLALKKENSSLLHFFLCRLGSLFRLAYNAFLLLNLAYIGHAEVLRLKNMYLFLAS